MTRITTPVAGGDTGNIDQYNNLRTEAEASSRLLAQAQATPNMTLRVSEGAVYFGATRVDYAGGNSGSFVAPVSNPRIDCLSIDKTGTLIVTQGAEGASPAEPTCPAGNLPICLVYNRVGETSIKQTSDGTNGYIYKDIRQVFINLESTFGTTTKQYNDADGSVTTIAHGLGRIPNKIYLNSFLGENSVGESFSKGIWKSSSQICIYQITSNGSSGSSNNTRNSGVFLSRRDGLEDYQEGIVTADSTNIYITWTKVGTTIATVAIILWEAF